MRHKVDATGNPTSTTIGASFMNWRGDIALGGNAQVSAIPAPAFLTFPCLQSCCKECAYPPCSSYASFRLPQTQVNYGKDTQFTGRANLNSRGAGQLTLRASTNERLQLALAGAVPVICAIVGRIQDGRQ